MSFVIIFTIGYVVGGVTGLTVLSLAIASSKADRMHGAVHEAYILSLYSANNKQENVISNAQRGDIASTE
jgi:hypothetical protein